ncbi:MAG: RICIN domain-containing protein [Lachnospiraceae bacterium]|nr:RICIN domain-containing protein [Lachnospiraceae bacterium]
MRREVLKSIIFIILTAILISFLNWVFTPSWSYHEDKNNEESTRFRDFYKLDENTLDYLVLGASQSFYSLSPMFVYGETGYTGYDLGSGMQSTALSYYWLKEACKTQKPKIVIMDVHALIRDPQGSEFIIKPLLGMKLSRLKLAAIRDCSLKLQTAYSALFPLYRFHDRWKELGSEDFIKPDESGYFMKGTMIWFQSSNKYLSPEISMRENEVLYDQPDGSLGTYIEEADISQSGAEYLQKIISFCEDNGITLIPVVFPSKKWNERWSELVGTYFRENTELKLIDLCADNAAGIDYDRDTPDNGFHLNYEGNTKVSCYFAGLLKDTGRFTDHRGDKAYEKWDNDLTRYYGWEKENVLNRLYPEENALGYLEALGQKKENYYIIYSGAEDITPIINDKTEELLENTGLVGVRNSAGEQMSFLAAVEGGKSLYQESSYRRMKYEYSLISGDGTSHDISLASSGMVSGDDSIINVDGVERSLNKTGLNIVVLDKKTGEFLSSANLGIDENDNLVFEESNAGNEEMDVSDVFSAGEYIIDSPGTSLKLQINNSGNNCVTLKNTVSGKYLFPEKAGNTPGTGISEGDGDLGTMYEWMVLSDPDGNVRIMSVYNSLFLKPSEDGDIILTDYDHAALWHIERTGEN